MRQRATLKMLKPAPLAGIRVVVGRAKHQAGALSAELGGLGATVVEIPFIEIRKPKSFTTLDSALKNIESYDWLILTSANGVDAMWERLARLRRAENDLTHLRIAAIGPATKQAIEQRGAKVDVVPKEYVAESVVRSLRRRVAGKRVLLVRAKVARDVIPRELRKAGAEVNVVEAYETVVPVASRVRLKQIMQNDRRRPDVVTFTSSSTAKNFVKLLGGRRAASRMLAAVRGQECLRPTYLASIGPITSATLREFGLPVDIQAQEFTIPGLVRAIVAANR